MTVLPLLAGALAVGSGLALVWAATRRRTVRVAVQTVPARKGPVRVRLRYALVAATPPDDAVLRDVLAGITKAAGEESKRLAGLVHEAREDWGISIVGIDVEPV
jgi:hypothetical protein